MRRLRCILPTEVYFVTIRTVEERFAITPHACPGAWQFNDGVQLDHDTRKEMAARGRECIVQTKALTRRIARAERKKQSRPEVPYSTFTDSIPNIIGSWLARGIAKYKINLYGVVWMSNHGHLLIQAPLDNFAEFMGYLNGQIAREVNRFLHRKHQLWSRRYAAAQVVDEAAELERLAYILANPQKAGIAECAEEWSGISSAAFLIEGQEQRFICFDRTSWHGNGRPDDIGPYLSTVKLEHQVLPQLKRLDTRSRRRKVQEMISEKVTAAGDSRADVDHDPLLRTRRQIQAQTTVATDRPAHPKSSPQPLCHTTKPSLYRLYREWYRRFRIWHKESAIRYIQGNTDVVFPPGAFAPSTYPRARRPNAPDKLGLLHPTRKNLAIYEKEARFT